MQSGKWLGSTQWLSKRQLLGSRRPQTSAKADRAKSLLLALSAVVKSNRKLSHPGDSLNHHNIGIFLLPPRLPSKTYNNLSTTSGLSGKFAELPLCCSSEISFKNNRIHVVIWIITDIYSPVALTHIPQKFIKIPWQLFELFCWHTDTDTHRVKHNHCQPWRRVIISKLQVMALRW